MTTYKVRSGDTLGKIAKKFYDDASRFPLIVTANNISNPDRLKAGQQLVIPDIDKPTGPRNSQRGTTVIPVDTNATCDLRNEQRLRQLHPVLAIRARCMLELCREAGIVLLVTQGLRTWEQQDELYAKGRTTPPLGKQHIVTYAKGGQSYHNFGLALDVVVLDAHGKANWDREHPSWKRIGDIGKSVGLAWGGDWKTLKDLPHFEYTCDLSLKACRDLYPSGLETLWSEII
jgi:hypothetical protein